MTEQKKGDYIYVGGNKPNPFMRLACAVVGHETNEFDSSKSYCINCWVRLDREGKPKRYG